MRVDYIIGAFWSACYMSLVPRVGRLNKKWQLLKVLLRQTSDLFVLFVQQQNNISTDTERARVSRR